MVLKSCNLLAPMNSTLPYLLILTMHQHNKHLDNTVQYSTVYSALAVHGLSSTLGKVRYLDGNPLIKQIQDENPGPAGLPRTTRLGPDSNPHGQPSSSNWKAIHNQVQLSGWNWTAIHVDRNPDLAGQCAAVRLDLDFHPDFFLQCDILVFAPACTSAL